MPLTMERLAALPPSTLAAAAGVAIALLYFVIAWWLVGRDPPRGVVVPQFAPPDNLSPDALRYLYAMTNDRKVFAAALVDMAVGGFLTIHQEDETFVLQKTGRIQDKALPASQAAAAKELFRDRKRIELRPVNADCVQDAVIKQAWALLDQCATYFTSNTGWLVGGVGILVLTLGGAILLTDDPGGTAINFVFLAIMIALTVGIVRWTGTLWIKARRRPGAKGGIGAILASLASVFVVLFVGALALNGFRAFMPFATTLILLAGAGMAWLFYRLLKAPSVQGAATFDKITGFRMFLMAAEKDRLEMLNPPAFTQETFEKFLPYAIALDCEIAWSKNFEAQVNASQLKPAPYRPGWFVGTALTLAALDSVTALGANLGSAAAAASVSPPSLPHHAGFGSLVVDGLLAGGGFSGGGRGGGGGGGW